MTAINDVDNPRPEGVHEPQERGPEPARGAGRTADGTQRDPRRRAAVTRPARDERGAAQAAPDVRRPAAGPPRPGDGADAPRPDTGRPRARDPAGHRRA